jgi:DNA-binding transcriptional LysR family regulator
MCPVFNIGPPAQPERCLFGSIHGFSRAAVVAGAGVRTIRKSELDRVVDRLRKGPRHRLEGRSRHEARAIVRGVVVLSLNRLLTLIRDVPRLIGYYSDVQHFSHCLLILLMYQYDMEFRQLKYFIAVAEELHFTRAAARLKMAQPPLSFQIRQLEKELEVTLFERTKRKVALTSAGHVFLHEAYRLVGSASAAIRAAQRAYRGETGRLNLGFVGSAAYRLLPALVRRYRVEYPDVQLALHEMSSAQQGEAFEAGRIDVGLVHPPVREDLNVIVETILREPLVVALPDHHPLASHAKVPLEKLANEDWILFPRQIGPGFHNRIMQVCQSGAGFTPRVVQEAPQMASIIGLVAAGLGLSLVPASLTELRRSGVVYRKLTSTATLELGMAWRRDTDHPIIAPFLDVVRAVSRSEGLLDVTGHDDAPSVRQRPAPRSARTNGRH